MNYFDTSPFYGDTKSETALGHALKPFERSQFVVSTKVGRYGEKEFDFSAKRVKRSLDESMERLGLNYIDLCICHDVEFGDVSQIATETIPMLKELQREGKIKHIGVSGLPLELFRRIFERSKDVEFILSYCHYTMFDTSLQNFWDEKLHGLGIGVINASPLSMGLLTKNGAPDWHPASSRIKSACHDVASYCSEKGFDIADIALNYSLKSSFPSSTLVGMKSPEMVRSNVAAISMSVPSDILDGTLGRLKVIQNETWQSGKPEYN